MILESVASSSARQQRRELDEAMDQLNELLEIYKSVTDEQVKELGAFNRNREYDVLMRDTSGMTPDQLRIHEHFCQHIKRKWGIE